jgi:hypothetical protein
MLRALKRCSASLSSGSAATVACNLRSSVNNAQALRIAPRASACVPSHGLGGVVRPLDAGVDYAGDSGVGSQQRRAGTRAQVGRFPGHEPYFGS